MSESAWAFARGASDAPGLVQLHKVAVQSGHPVEAVMLVMHVLSSPPASVGASAAPSEGVSGGVPAHVGARDLCRALIHCARTSYGDRALSALEEWDLDSSEAVGRIVAGLVANGLVKAGPGDSDADFEGLFDADDLVRELAGAGDSIAAGAKGGEAPRTTLVPRLIEQHFQPSNVQDLAVSERQWPYRIRVDLQRAVDRIFGSDLVVSHFSSVRKQHAYMGLSLHDLMVYDRHDNAVAMPPHYEEVDIGEEQPVKCLTNGFWLARHGEGPLAILMAPGGNMHRVTGVKFQIAARGDAGGADAVSAFFRKLELAVQESRSYRGKVLSLEEDDHYSGQPRGITVHRLRTVAREEVILPRRTLGLLERNVLQFVDRRTRLASLGMQTKKGLLFYGPPGTGKTHTIHFLAGSLRGHTTLLITAEQVALLPEYMALARLLQPSLVVIEDADLIARDRQHLSGPCQESMLNKLLNEMDGLREETDVLFILTTNRPEMLEPALTARPGRIDQAIEFPLPDDECRLRLIRLYARGAGLTDDLVHTIAGKTKGVSGAFIKELMRRAAQFHAERSDSASIDLRDVDDAIEEMLFAGGTLNRRLLGATAEPAGG